MTNPRNLGVVVEDPPPAAQSNGYRIDWGALADDVDAAGGRWVKLVEPVRGWMATAVGTRLGDKYEVTSRGVPGSGKGGNRVVFVYVRRMVDV